MTEPNLDEQLDEILKEAGKAIANNIVYKTNEVAHTRTKLKTLIANQVREARIDEVKRMREAMTFAHMTPSIYAAERIKNILGDVEL